MPGAARFCPRENDAEKTEYCIAGWRIALCWQDQSVLLPNRQAQPRSARRNNTSERPLEPLYREMVKALADLSIRNNDVQLRELLAKQGITVPSNAAFGPNAPPGNAAAPRISGNEARKGAK